MEQQPQDQALILTRGTVMEPQRIVISPDEYLDDIRVEMRQALITCQPACYLIDSHGYATATGPSLGASMTQLVDGQNFFSEIYPFFAAPLAVAHFLQAVASERVNITLEYEEPGLFLVRARLMTIRQQAGRPVLATVTKLRCAG